ncbi:MAG: hypothetical protein ACRC0G_15875 [Fusobacteriaceae bacterium]
MKISINETMKVEYQSGNWIIREEKGIDKDGKKLSNIIGYYGTLESAIKSAFHKKLVKSGGTLKSVDCLAEIYEKQAINFFEKLKVEREDGI